MCYIGIIDDDIEIGIGGTKPAAKTTTVQPPTVCANCTTLFYSADAVRYCPRCEKHGLTAERVKSRGLFARMFK